MSQRINYSQQSPELLKKLTTFSQSLSTAIEPSLRHLVDLRASQINGCAFCVDIHVKEATIHGERALRLHHVAVWRESPLFDARERAALAWTEAVTRLGEHGVPDAVFNEVREVLSEKELSDLTFVVLSINAWNRLGVAFTNVPGSLDAALGLSKANLA